MTPQDRGRFSVLANQDAEPSPVFHDDQGRVTRQTYEDGSYVTYHYDNSGALAKVYDSESGTTTTYYYDFTDRMMKYVETDGDSTHSVGYAYDNLNNLTALVETIGTVERKTTYTYDDDNRTTSIATENTSRSYTYDAYGRIFKDETKQGDTSLFTRTYRYRSGSSLLNQLSYSNGVSENFTVHHDSNGNIVVMNDGTASISFFYDSANQLIQENNRQTETATFWSYDDSGNILKREVYKLINGTPDLAQKISEVNYTYADNKGWGDLLTLAVQIPLGVAVYVLASVIFKVDSFNYILSIAKKFIPGKKEA